MSRRKILGSVLALGAVALSLGVAAPAGAAPLATVNWSVSKPHPGDTAVRYTYAFTTATAATLSRVTFSVPAGTVGTALSVADAYGVPTGGTASLSGTTATYAFAPASVGANVKVLVAIDGFTNTTTPGTYASAVNTFDNAGSPALVDTGSSNTVTFDNNATAVTVVVARSTAFDNDTDSFTLLMDPSNPALADASRAVTLNVRTNGTGYGLAMKATALQNAGATYSIAPATAGVAAGVAPGAFPVNRWGYSVGALSGDAVGVRQGALVAGDYAGYTTGGETVVSSSGPTNNDVVTVANRVKIDFKQVATTYTSTITYTVTPTY